MIRLLSHPEELRGELVGIRGYLAAEWDGPIVFFSRDHCQQFRPYDGIGLELKEELNVDWSVFQNPNCRRVYVEGYFNFRTYEPPQPNTIRLRVVNSVLRNVTYVVDMEEEFDVR